MKTMNLVLHTVVPQYGDSPALSVGSNTKYTYNSLQQQITKISSGLTQMKIPVGERVAIVMTNHVEFYPLLFGAWKCGLVVVPVNAYEPIEKVIEAISTVRPKICFGNRKHIKALQSNVNYRIPFIDVDSSTYTNFLTAQETTPSIDISEESPAWIMFTSGTTSKPKGVVLSHKVLYNLSKNLFRRSRKYSIKGNFVTHLFYESWKWCTWISTYHGRCSPNSAKYK